MKKIIGFGDSFIFGSEIPNNDDGSKGWPGLAAKDLGAEYVTLATPGCSNDAIARQIYHYFSNNTADDTLAVVNWTWTMRWDFYITAKETWITLGPSCVPENLQRLVDVTQSHRLVDFYNDYANSSVLWNKVRNLQTIFGAQQYMKTKGVKNIQTYMDPVLFDKQWHCPDYVQELQDLVKLEMQDWDGKNFLDWCDERKHQITGEGQHPLLSAHEDAANYWKDRYAQALA